MATAYAKAEPARDMSGELFVPGITVKEKAPERKQRPAVFRFPAPAKPLTENDAIRAVLEKAAKEPGFIAELTYHGSEALASYPLSWQAKAALLSGDVQWVEAKLGKLDARLRTWLDRRLQQEIW